VITARGRVPPGARRPAQPEAPEGNPHRVVGVAARATAVVGAPVTGGQPATQREAAIADPARLRSLDLGVLAEAAETMAAGGGVARRLGCVSRPRAAGVQAVASGQRGWRSRSCPIRRQTKRPASSPRRSDASWTGFTRLTVPKAMRFRCWYATTWRVMARSSPWSPVSWPLSSTSTCRPPSTPGQRAKVARCRCAALPCRRITGVCRCSSWPRGRGCRRCGSRRPR
jgi:hypothetical protein